MTETTFTLDSISQKIQKLLAKANDPSVGPEEAALFAAKAEQLMTQYRVEAAEGIEEGGQKPEWATIFVGPAGEWSNHYYTIATRLARHNGIRISVKWDGQAETRGYYGTVCGFAHDVRFFELMYTSVLSAFSARLEPRFNPDESAEANALRLREGGMERKRIAVALGMLDDLALAAPDWHGRPAVDLNTVKAATRKVTGLIKRRAQQLGNPALAEEVLGRTFNAKTYRSSYADGFLDALINRLRTLALGSHDAGLVLASAKERVDEAWYERFPHLRPAAPGTVEPYVPCAKCAAAKSGSCRAHTFRKTPEKARNWTAVERGRDAARSVDLGAGGSRRSL
jgi:hypothetical protein